MRRWIATIASALLFAGAAAADPEGATEADLTEAWASIERKIDAAPGQEIDASVDRALGHHLASTEALREIRACNAAISQGAEASATERHRRLTACLGQRRSSEGLVAANQGLD